MAKPQTDRELRAHVAKRLKQPKVPEWAWREVEGFRRDYLETCSPDHLEDVVFEVRRLFRIGRLAAGRRPVPGRPTVAPQVERLTPEADVKRARAFSNYLGMRAARTEEVRRFRGLVLGGSTISDAQAARLASSPAAQVFHREWFERAGVPVAAHEAFYVDRRPAEPGGQMREVQPISPSDTMGIRVRWAKRTMRIPFGASAYFDLTKRGGDTLAVPTRFKEPRRIPVQYGSVLDDLRRVSTELAKSYPWSEADATWFVLTGKVPLVPALRIEFEDGARRLPLDHQHLRITLSAQPWVSGATVRRVYEYFRQAVFKRGSRPLGLRSIALFDFIESRRDAEGQLPRWRMMMKDWNRAHPEWSYGDDARRFCRDYSRVARPVVLPDYTFPPDEPAEKGRMAGRSRRGTQSTTKRTHS